jgi:hypothetical protein
VKIFPHGAGTETPGTGVDLPNARTFSFTEASDSEELRGDDGVVAIHDLGSSVEWELEGGGVSFEALKALFGGTIAETGTTPAQKKTYTKNDTDLRPYVSIVGQVISDSGGDVHCVLHKAKATGELSGEFADGQFFLTSASGRAIGRTSDRKMYEFRQNETAVPLTTTFPT